MLTDDARGRALERLDASRATLLAALEGVTERDFATDLGDGTVVQLLASLAQAERHAVAEARDDARESREPAQPLPPQVMHDLAGARHQTRRYVESEEAAPEAVERIVAGIETREADAAERIRERPRHDPPPTIPVIQP